MRSASQDTSAICKLHSNLMVKHKARLNGDQPGDRFICKLYRQLPSECGLWEGDRQYEQLISVCKLYVLPIRVTCTLINMRAITEVAWAVS